MRNRVVTILLACAFAVFAGDARAQLDACTAPTDIPNELTYDMVFFFGGAFGGLDMNTCQKLVAGAVKACRAAARRAAACQVEWQRGLYKTRHLLCGRLLEDPGERRDCRATVRENFQADTQDVKNDRDLALLQCGGTFEGNLLEACLEGTP